MSFEMMAINYDATRQKNRYCYEALQAVGTDTNKKAKFYTGVPYTLNYELNIYAKTQDDALQIVEQILPTFNPSYSVTINPISTQSTISQDVKFLLTGTSISDQYEGVFTERNILIYTLTFDVKTVFYSGISDSEVIKTAIANIYDFDNQTDLIKGTSYAVAPSTAKDTDVYTITVTETFGFDSS